MPFLYKFFLYSAVLGPGCSYSFIYLFHFALFFLVIRFVLRILLGRIDNNINLLIIKIYPSTKFHYFFYIMLSWYSLSLIWCENFIYGLQYLFYIILGLSIILFFVYYADSLERQNQCFRCLSVIFIIEILISLLEIQTDFRMPVSPFSPHVTYFGRKMGFGDNLSDELLSYINTMPTGFQWNPNNLSVTMVMILPFFLFNKRIFIKFFGLISIIWIVVQSGSKGAFIGFCATIFLYLFFFDIKRAAISLVGIFPIFYLSYFSFCKTFESVDVPQKISEIESIPQVVTSYFFDEYYSANNSIEIRKLLIKNGIVALKDTYGLGVGGGGSKQIQENQDGSILHIKSMHNFWIEILVEGGVFFAVIFFIWYLYVIFYLFLIGHKSCNPILKYFSQSLFVSMSTFVISAISASSVIYLLPMWLLFGLSIATINNYFRAQYSKI